MKTIKKIHLNNLSSIIKSNLLNKEKVFLIISLSTLTIISFFLSHYTIKFHHAKAQLIEIGHDTTIFLQKVWNSINGRPFVSSEKFGCGGHHWDITIVLLFGPILKIFQNPFIIIDSTILIFWTSLIIFFIFYFSLNYDKKQKILISFLISLAYLFNDVVIIRGSSIDYHSSTLFAPLFTLSTLLFIKKKYKLAGFLMLLSYMVNLETIPYLVLLFFGTILILFRKNIPENEKKAIYGYILLTVGYIVLFHFVLYGYLTDTPGENVFSFYYARHKVSTEENPIITLIKNTLNITPHKVDYIINTFSFLPPFSFNPSVLFTVLMGLSVNEKYVFYYTSPEAHYNLPNPIFTILLLWAFLYYKKPSKKAIYIILGLIVIALIIKIPKALSRIDWLLSYIEYANNMSNNPYLLEKWEELNYLIKNYIKQNESITVPDYMTFIFFKHPLVFRLAPYDIINDCRIQTEARCHGKICAFTYYYLFLKTDNSTISLQTGSCKKDILEKNLEEQGYEKIYEGKYFILFKIKNESLVYYGRPLIDLKILK